MHFWILYKIKRDFFFNIQSIISCKGKVIHSNVVGLVISKKLGKLADKTSLFSEKWKTTNILLTDKSVQSTV